MVAGQAANPHCLPTLPSVISSSSSSFSSLCSSSSPLLPPPSCSEPCIRACLDHVEPPLTWRYDSGLRVWPFVIAAVVGVLAAFAFLVASNYNSQTCARVLQFRDWHEPAPADCHVLEEALGDWSQFVMELPPGYLNLLTNPLVLASSLSESATYSPSSCRNMTLQALDMIISLRQFRYLNSTDYYASVVMNVSFGFEPLLRLNVRGFVDPRLGPLLAPGVIRMLSENYTEGALPEKYGSTLPLQVTMFMFRSFWPLLAVQSSLMAVSACGQFIHEKHLMECYACFGDSWSTIVWIIIIGSIQAVAVIDGAAVWCLRLHNRRHQLEPRGAYDPQVALADGETPFISLLPV